MKLLLLVVAILFSTTTFSQKSNPVKNIFIITSDGLRWQEIFKGADPDIINNPSFVSDTSLLKDLYWAESEEERRKKLMPFFWNVIAKQGQLYGNRIMKNKVDVKNIYKISYPGYNELLTGFADPLPMLNYPLNNKNINILEYLNNMDEYAGKVVAFSSWNLFPYILNSKRNNLPLNSGYAPMQNATTEEGTAINDVQSSIKEKKHTRYDLLTFLNAKLYIKEHHPRVMFLSLGETDEEAHEGHYDTYLQRINDFDKMIDELWYLVQSDPQYRNNTCFIITADHGRGEKATKWMTHNLSVKGSSQIWLALLGKNILPNGEMNNPQQINLNQITATIANILGTDFKTNVPIGKPIALPSKTLPGQMETAASVLTVNTK